MGKKISTFFTQLKGFGPVDRFMYAPCKNHRIATQKQPTDAISKAAESAAIAKPGSTEQMLLKSFAANMKVIWLEQEK